MCGLDGSIASPGMPGMHTLHNYTQLWAGCSPWQWGCVLGWHIFLP